MYARRVDAAELIPRVQDHPERRLDELLPGHATPLIGRTLACPEQLKLAQQHLPRSDAYGCG
jgi:hypothetical protein